MDFMNFQWDALPDKLANFGIKLAIALIIFFIGNWITRAISKAISGFMVKGKTDRTIASFLGNVVYAILLLIVVLTALNMLGVKTSSFSVIVGAAVLAIGVAMQGTLSNLAAGVMLIGLHPFKLGDTVIAGGQTGTVHDIGILSTTVLTSDNKKIIVPNSAISGGAITNFSAMPTRKIELTVAVPGTSDLSRTRDLIMGVINAESRVLKDPAPGISIADATAADIKFGVSAHVNNVDMSATQSALLESIKKALTEAGIWA
jgi:small conductance mechanosensitive channel